MTDTPKLTAAKVEAILRDCLFKDDEPMEPRVEAHGIVNNFGFHPERLASHKAEIAELLNELPDDFQRGKGGGWSFLMACRDKDGRQWGEHPDMERLLCLGIACGFARQMFDKDFWKVLPGGMPYYVIDTTGKLMEAI